METTDRKLYLQDFGMGIFAGLRLHRVSLLSDRDLPGFHGAFKAAYTVVEQQYDKGRLRFNFILDQIHGTTPHADEIVNWWLSTGYATRDSPGNTIRMTPIDIDETQKLIASIPGSEELWYKAADAFRASYPGYI